MEWSIAIWSWSCSIPIDRAKEFNKVAEVNVEDVHDFLTLAIYGYKYAANRLAANVSAQGLLVNKDAHSITQALEGPIPPPLWEAENPYFKNSWFLKRVMNERSGKGLTENAGVIAQDVTTMLLSVISGYIPSAVVGYLDQA